MEIYIQILHYKEIILHYKEILNNFEKGFIFTIKSNNFGLKQWRFFEWSLTQIFKYNGKISIYDSLFIK